MFFFVDMQYYRYKESANSGYLGDIRLVGFYEQRVYI